ncbi:hypothetical protein EN864_34180, partial [bacterium M00.F.Ca.ET.221.01.1.1]
RQRNFTGKPLLTPGKAELYGPSDSPVQASANLQAPAGAYQFGVSEMFPDKWERFLAPIPQSERGDMIRRDRVVLAACR